MIFIWVSCGRILSASASPFGRFRKKAVVSMEERTNWPGLKLWALTVLTLEPPPPAAERGSKSPLEVSGRFMLSQDTKANATERDRTGIYFITNARLAWEKSPVNVFQK